MFRGLTSNKHRQQIQITISSLLKISPTVISDAYQNEVFSNEGDRYTFAVMIFRILLSLVSNQIKSQIRRAKIIS